MKNKGFENQQICKFFSQGSCKFGNNCKFLHVEGNKSQFPKKNQMDKICRNFLGGKCDVLNCKFPHKYNFSGDIDLGFHTIINDNPSIVCKSMTQIGELIAVCRENGFIFLFQVMPNNIQPHKQFSFPNHHFRCMTSCQIQIDNFNQQILVIGASLPNQSNKMTFGIFAFINENQTQFVEGHQDNVSDISSLLNTIITCSLDCTIRIWKCSNQGIVPSISVSFPETSAQFTALHICKGNYIMGATKVGFIGIWTLQENNKMVYFGKLSHNIDQTSKSNDRLITCLDSMENWLFASSYDGTISLFNLNDVASSAPKIEVLSKKKLQRLPNNLMDHRILSIKVMMDSLNNKKILIIGMMSGSVIIKNLDQGFPNRATLTKQKGSINKICVVNNIGFLTLSNDSSICLWLFKPAISQPNIEVNPNQISNQSQIQNIPSNQNQGSVMYMNQGMNFESNIS